MGVAGTMVFTPDVREQAVGVIGVLPAQPAREPEPGTT